MANLEFWNKVKQPPKSALKQIQAGRLKGMTDINPQWRIEAMTEHFGQIGIGWYYEVQKFWTEAGAGGELMAFVHIHLFTCFSQANQWSAPIVGIGGSALVAKESAGLRANDEGYKMALTDALSVAMKQLGVGSDIYMGRYDGSKYKEEEPPTNKVPPPNESAKTITRSEWDNLDGEEQKFLQGIADTVILGFESFDIETAVKALEDAKLDGDEKVAIWSRFDSKLRSAIKTYQAEKMKEGK